MQTSPTAFPVPANYVERINRAIDHVRRHLAEPLSLEDVAGAAPFSPFHFHRIFKAMLGETLNQFVKRQRLERALFLMSHAPGKALTSIALECGFSSSSDFSRSFRQQHGVSPSRFNLAAFRADRREAFERAMAGHDGSPRCVQLPAGHNPDGFEVTLRRIPARSVAYVRVLDPYRDGVVQAACDRLLAWAGSNGCADGQWLGYMWDEPEIVPLARCRYDVAVVVEGPPLPDGEIGRFEFPQMTVAEVMVRGDIELEARAFDWLYQTWLPRSGYVPADQPCFEAWIGQPFAHGASHFELACQLPVMKG